MHLVFTLRVQAESHGFFFFFLIPLQIETGIAVELQHDVLNLVLT